MPSYVTSIPALKKKRLDRLLLSDSEAAQLASEHTERPSTVPPKFWTNCLHMSVDCAGLRESHLSPQSTRWIDSWTKLMTGASYVQACKMRLGVVTTPARSARGRDADPNCKLGCAVPGTAHHIMQVSPSVQPCRIRRHDSEVQLVSSRLRSQGFTVLVEPHIPTQRGTRIPDIVAWRRESSYVLDAQVCGDANAIALRDAHQMKVSKYSLPEVLEYVRRRAGGDSITTVSSITVSWRGILAPDTIKTFRQSGPSRGLDRYILITVGFRFAREFGR